MYQPPLSSFLPPNHANLHYCHYQLQSRYDEMLVAHEALMEASETMMAQEQGLGPASGTVLAQGPGSAQGSGLVKNNEGSFSSQE